MNDINVDLFGEQESLFSDEVLDELSLIIKKYPDDDIIEDAFNYFRKPRFPYPDLTLFEMKQEINRLANTVKESCLRSTVAYKVADSFHKHRFHSSAIGMRNPLQSYNIDKSLSTVNHIQESNLISFNARSFQFHFNSFSQAFIYVVTL